MAYHLCYARCVFWLRSCEREERGRATEMTPAAYQADCALSVRAKGENRWKLRGEVTTS